MNWIFSNLLANIAVITLEAVYRGKVFVSFWASLPFVLPFIFLGQWALFHTWRNAPSYFLAAVSFTLINTILRIGINNLYLHEPFYLKTGIAIGLLVVACILLK
jgi:hypothetical protein